MRLEVFPRFQGLREINGYYMWSFQISATHTSVHVLGLSVESLSANHRLFRGNTAHEHTTKAVKYREGYQL